MCVEYSVLTFSAASLIALVPAVDLPIASLVLLQTGSAVSAVEVSSQVAFYENILKIILTIYRSRIDCESICSYRSPSRRNNRNSGTFRRIAS